MQTTNVYHKSSTQTDPLVQNDVDHMLVNPRALAASVEGIIGDYTGHIQVNVSPNISTKPKVGRSRDNMAVTVPSEKPQDRYHESYN